MNYDRNIVCIHHDDEQKFLEVHKIYPCLGLSKINDFVKYEAKSRKYEILDTDSLFKSRIDLQECVIILSIYYRFIY